MNFKIYNQRFLYILITILGLLNVFLAITIKGNFIHIISGSFMSLVGILLLINPALVIDDKNIYVKNGFGMTVKTYSYTLDTLRYENSRFWVGDKKLGVIGWMLEKKSLQAFLDYLEKNKK
ncbi:MAG: hypothetical protein MUC49_08080 [Raineya sp.]|jgi:hypothetical protein|nr:hypothetical protein [Raineya sp.]